MIEFNIFQAATKLFFDFLTSFFNPKKGINNMKTHKLLIVSFVAWALAACSGQTEQAASKPTETPASAAMAVNTPLETPPAFIPNAAWKTYNIGTEANYPPFEYRNKQSELIGFEIDVLYAVAQAGEFNPNVMFAPLSNWKKMQTEKTTDAWASGFVQSADLEKENALSQPFLENKVVVSVSEKSGIKSLADLKGKKISVSQYYTADMMALAAELTGNKDNVVVSESIFLSIKDVYTGKADAVLGEDKPLIYFGNENKDMPLSILETTAPVRNMVFVVNKDNPELLAKFNNGLAKIKANGEYDKIVAKWFSK